MLGEILSSKVRAGIFKLLFGIDNASLHMREIERKSGFSIGTVQRELKKLEELELVTKKKDGNRVYYQANTENPIYQDICNLTQKTIGLVFLLKKSLKKEKKIEFAFIFGSIASGKEKSNSDLDLMIIGDIGLRRITSLLSNTIQTIKREINPHIFSKSEFIDRITNNEHFISNVMNSDQIFLIGNENEFKKLV